MLFVNFMMASYAVSLLQLYLTQGLLQSFGLSFVSLPALTFVRLSSCGSGVGEIVFNLGMQKVIEARDYHCALRAQAIICCWSHDFRSYFNTYLFKSS
ncbi:DEHA2B00264p [Debaryomyces hansenii CBS767]|uniref:DEHA2B00264p n=1 Tax=Debaryomyces hansenii (strain ATCC 36239 / CBS 767 / BCRC 21394 / JCM 1990 / NBRC 0083 / IGC 2968) TaxID=284592 RepID=Q6BXU1_DEBHA|nr:DEHA2B00264p [Debaryomyces hansenii CBS767]CAG84958.1 DEHA2B00264p [Debaryomyces hansenii CBS767]|eukprot:XP_456978.1 DEHA2B00264p [Debaryomyces hansenii CBS767]